MDNFCFAFFGLVGTGKSTASKIAKEYLGNSCVFVNVRRLFESNVGKEYAKELYHRINSNSPDRTAWLNFMHDELQTLQCYQYIVIEGLFTQAESIWCRRFYNRPIINIYLQTNEADRTLKVAEREIVGYSKAVTIVEYSDEGRKAAGVHKANSWCQVLLTNDYTEGFNRQIENVLSATTNSTKFPGLKKLSEILTEGYGEQFSIFDALFFIRQLSIGHGCLNQCSHCFSNSPTTVSQMALADFSLIICEVGKLLTISHQSLRFFHFGASTDPSSIKGYCNYLKKWVESLPEWQSVKIFTHCWNLNENRAKREFEDLLALLPTIKDKIQRIVISFDEFSIYARNDWSSYLLNVTSCMRRLLGVLPFEKIRIETFYHPARCHCHEQYCLEYWRQKISNDDSVLYEDIESDLKQAKIDDDIRCAKTTLGIIEIFKGLELPAKRLFEMTRDCNTIFAGGRGKSFFIGKYLDDTNKALQIQQKNVLYPLANSEHNDDGCIIYPDGKIRLVNYLGFQKGKYLNEGTSVIPYFYKKKNV